MLLSSALSATSVLKLQDEIDAYTDFNVEYFENTSDAPLTIEQIRKEKFQTTSNAFSFGYNKNDFWFRISIANDSDKEKMVFLELTEIIHKNLDLYIISSNDSVVLERNGLSVPVKERQIKVVNPTFLLYFDPGEKKELYVKLSSIYGVFGAIHVKTPQKLYQSLKVKDHLYIFYFGAIITIGLYNLFLFFFLRDKVYLYYVAYVFIFVVWSANYKGILLPYITIDTYDILQIIIPLFFTLLILFSQEVLETKKNFLNFHYVLNGFIGIFMMSLIWMLIDMHSGFYFMNVFMSPLLPFLLLTSLWALYKGHKIAKIYIGAVSIYMFTIAILGQVALGFIPYTVLFSNAPIIGSFIEIILLSVLLAYRITIIRREHMMSQQILLDHKATESIRFSNMLDEKILELSNSNNQLEIELEKKKKLENILRHRASTDSLTGILNRRAFYIHCAKTMNLAKRYNKDLSLAIIDIDKFKEINDTYGHASGDIILKELVNVIQDTIRSTDIFGRIGGDEFTVLMPETEMNDAKKLAERIRKNISVHKNLLKEKNINLSITVSIGITSRTHKDKTIQNILKRADLALYKAKEDGRNKLRFS